MASSHAIQHPALEIQRTTTTQCSIAEIQETWLPQTEGNNHQEPKTLAKAETQALKTNAGMTVIACICPLAGVVETDGRTPPVVEKAYSDIIRTRDLLHEQLAYEHVYDFGYSGSRSIEHYGGICQMFHLEADMYDIAFDFYLDMWGNKERIKKLYIIAAESAAYMIIRLLKFMDKYGISDDGIQQFQTRWSAFISSPDESTPCESKFSIPIRYVILIHPSLPSPQGLGYAYWWLKQPTFYHHKDLSIDNLPCQFLWWSMGDVEEPSVMDINVKAISSRRIKLENMATLEDKLKDGMTSVFTKKQLRLFWRAFVEDLHRAVQVLSQESSPDIITAIQVIDHWCQADHGDWEKFERLIDLNLEAKELLGLKSIPDGLLENIKKVAAELE